MEFPTVGKTVRCAQCGETVERAARCSNCGSRLKYPGSIFLKVLSVAFIGLGIILVSQLIKNRVPRPIKVAQIKPYMNFRKVQVEGVLLEKARVLKSGSAFYLVYDGSGQIPVFSAPPENGVLPLKDTKIVALGSLRVGVGDLTSLQATHVEVLGRQEMMEEGAENSLAQISVAQKGDMVRVQGLVSEVWNPKPGSRAPYKIILEDSTGSLAVIHWLDEPPVIKIGEPLEVSGIVQVYDGRVELKVLKSEWIARQD